MVGTRETGNETYCAGLLEGLSQLDDPNHYIAYTRSQSALTDLDRVPNIQRRVLARDSSAWRLTLGFAEATRRDSLDLLHVTYNVPVFSRCPLVVAVHDISFVH